jgi:hypothetical protein
MRKNSSPATRRKNENLLVELFLSSFTFLYFFFYPRMPASKSPLISLCFFLCNFFIGPRPDKQLCFMAQEEPELAEAF